MHGERGGRGESERSGACQNQVVLCYGRRFLRPTGGGPSNTAITTIGRPQATPGRPAAAAGGTDGRRGARMDIPGMGKGLKYIYGVRPSL